MNWELIIVETLRHLADSNPDGFKFNALCGKRDGRVIYGQNQVSKLNDPTAHGEIQAIRNWYANYQDEPEFIISSGEPCPMCLTAIAWAGIKTVYYIRDWQAADENNDYYDQDCEKVNKFLNLGLDIHKLSV